MASFEVAEVFEVAELSLTTSSGEGLAVQIMARAADLLLGVTLQAERHSQIEENVVINYVGIVLF